MAKSKTTTEPTIEEPIVETPIVETTEEVVPPLLDEAIPQMVLHGYPSRDFYTEL